MATTIGLVVGDSGAPTAGDSGLRSRIEALGFVVTYVDDSASVPTGLQGFVIAASTVAATVGTKYDAVALPVLTANHDLWDENRLSANVGASTASSAAYDLETHAITAGLADPLTILSSAQTQRGVLNASVATGATVFARPGADSGRASGWAVDTGGALTSGTAPARRVALFLPDAWLALLTTVGQTLVEQALSWLFRVMTVTYDSVLSRVRITADGLGAATTALVERSTNQVTWTTVRGGAAAAVSSSGSLATAVDDYEFAAGVVNYYRVVTPAAPLLVNVGAAAHAVNAAVTPTLPAGIAAGDVLFVLAAIRNSGAGVPTQPTGYITLVDASNMKIFGKIAGGSESAPTISFTGGVANADTSAQMVAFRNATLNAFGNAIQLNASAQSISTPQLTVDPITEAFVLYAGWKQDDWTSVAPVTDGIEIGEPSTITGDDQGITWAYRNILPTSAFTVLGQRTFTVTGGAAAISRGATLVLEPADLVQTNSITPVLDEVWLKSIRRPFLNRAVKPLKYVTWQRRARNGVFDVVGRGNPVGVTDVRSGRELVIRIPVDTDQERDELDLALASGDPVFLHCPPTYPTASLYAVVGDVTFDEFLGVFTLPLTEVAAPGPGVVGATNTYQSILNSYASYSALLAGEPTYKDVVERIGSPADVVVP